MKKTFKNIRTLAALLIASAAFTACSNEDSAIIGEQPAQQQAPQVFTLTLQAGKTDGARTRALELDGTKLVAKWAAGDQLTVLNVTTPPPCTPRRNIDGFKRQRRRQDMHFLRYAHWNHRSR